MNDRIEFVVLTSDESACVQGGFGWAQAGLTAFSIVVGECVKYSASFAEGFKQGYQDSMS